MRRATSGNGFSYEARTPPDPFADPGGVTRLLCSPSSVPHHRSAVRPRARQSRTHWSSRAPFCCVFSLDELVGGRKVHVRGLDPDASRAGEAIEDELPGAAEHAGLEPVDLLLHRDARIAIDPTARLDVDRFAGVEPLLEHVAVAVQPHDENGRASCRERGYITD